MKIEKQQLRALQLAELEILLAIDKACKENGIDYFLDSGTMLGAARHGGFIPWDDDVDVAMTRDSYERFLEVGQDALGPRFFLQTRDTDPTALHSFAKVRMNGTEMVEAAAEDSGAHQGIWVDVFPFDTIGGSERNVARKRRQWKLRHKLYSVRLTKLPQPSLNVAKRVARRTAHVLLSILPIDFYIRRLNELRDEGHPNADTRFVCFHYSTRFVPLRFEDVFPIGNMEFEGHQLPVPHNWELYLEMTYGDWRALPPVNQRRTHSVVSLRLPDGESAQ